MRTDILFSDKALLELINMHEQLINGVIGKIEDVELNQIIEKCIKLAQDLGLHYGHHAASRRCCSKHLLKTQNNMSIINLKYTYENLVKAIKIISLKAKNNERFIFCTQSKLNTKYENINIINKWIPGMLTNKNYVLKKLDINQNSFFNIIISQNTKSYSVINKEVIKHNELSKNKTIFIGFIDTNISSNNNHNDIIQIIINDDSPFYNYIFAYFIETLINKSIIKT